MTQAPTQPPASPKPISLKQTEIAYKGYRLLASGRGQWQVLGKNDAVVTYDGKTLFKLIEAKQVVAVDLKG